MTEAVVAIARYFTILDIVTTPETQTESTLECRVPVIRVSWPYDSRESP
ncbi:hypothetical protein [Paracoccus sp. (in: a-proteobacteria)]|nr:hypothetical protein [Paracoccus sp. (in: a-proteobacteria)]